MKTIDMEVELTAESKAQRSTVRIIWPVAKDWPGELLVNRWWERGDFDTHALAARLVQLNDLIELDGRRNDRVFSPEQLQRCSDFQWIAGAVGHGPVGDVAPRLYGAIAKPMDEIFSEARYARPLRSIPVDYASYVQFRDALLDEVDKLDAFLVKASRKFSDDPDRCERAIEHARPQIMRLIARQMLKTDSRDSATYADLADRADAMSIEADQRYARNRRIPLRRCFDWKQVDALLGDAVTALRALPDETPERAQNVTLLEAARRGRSLHSKVEAVKWIWGHLRSRAPLFEHLLLDVEHAQAYMLGRASQQLYREIRSFLTPPERRLFALMYFERLPRLGGPTPVYPLGGLSFWSDPVVGGLLGDGVTLELIIAVIGFKVLEQDGESLVDKLEQRLKAQLSFYPVWLAMTRDRERTARSNRRAAARRRDSADVERVAAPSPDPPTPGRWMQALRDALATESASRVLKKSTLNGPN